MKRKDNHITINPDEIVVHLDSSERIAIPRSKLRTRLQLLDWTYSLLGRPGMTLPKIRALIAGVFRHHGWALPLPWTTYNQKLSLQSHSSHGD
jgi:hypothetical protein